jgi:hypothetical protein
MKKYYIEPFRIIENIQQEWILAVHLCSLLITDYVSIDSSVCFTNTCKFLINFVTSYCFNSSLSLHSMIKSSIFLSLFIVLLDLRIFSFVNSSECLYAASSFTYSVQFPLVRQIYIIMNWHNESAITPLYFKVAIFV